MSTATSSTKLGISNNLVDQWNASVAQKSRFVKVVIVNEIPAFEKSVPASGSFADDLALLQGSEILKDAMPAYLFARLDSDEWLDIFYVPANSNVKMKMQYALSHVPLVKLIGGSLIIDSIHATSKADLTPEAYEAHKRHQNAPSPLSAREQEMADLRAAEAETNVYSGSQSRQSPVGTGVGLKWTDEVEATIRELGDTEGSRIVILTIDPQSETLLHHSSIDAEADHVGSTLPASDPCFAFFSWSQPSRRDIVFIYSCPSSSSIKHRMLYSSGSSSVYQTAKSLFPPTLLATRKIETSSPDEVNESYLQTELGLEVDSGKAAPAEKGFARPKGPARKR